MSEENKTETTEQDKNTVDNSSSTNLRLSDDLIAVVRELVQLSLLTGTNVVDHLRAVRAEVIEGKVVPTEKYINAYNQYVEKLQEETEKAQQAAQQTVATDTPAVTSEETH